MIGMSQIRKRLMIGLAIGLGVGIIGIIVTIVISTGIVKSYENGTNERFLADYTKFVVTFNRDVIQGEKVTSDMVSMQRVHINTVSSAAYASSAKSAPAGIIGSIAKYNIPKGTTVTNNMLGEYIIGNSVRLQQINSVVLPVDLVENEYVDVRLKVPSGVDYIVLVQKQVLKIEETTIWVELSEEELLLLNSAIVDSYLNKGTQLYAVKYADPNTQIKIGGDAALTSAKEYLVTKIAEEVANMDSVTVQIPVETPEIDTIIDTTTEEGIETTTETTEVPPVTVRQETRVTTTAQTLVDLIATYADEYKYYVESFKSVQTNYQPNAQVMAYMKANAYIVDTAKAKLNSDIRLGIEAGIAAFENSYGDDYDSLVEKITDSVETQMNLRETILGEE